MKNLCKENLNEISALLKVLSFDQYTQQSKLLSGSSIGQHVRHILEFYTCLLKGANQGKVNYDLRERDFNIENVTTKAISCIDQILAGLDRLENIGDFILEGNFTKDINRRSNIKTSLERELAYCLEHSIHHQALIKIALIDQNSEQMINESFGVAPATIRHKEAIFTSERVH